METNTIKLIIITFFSIFTIIGSIDRIIGSEEEIRVLRHIISLLIKIVCFALLVSMI